MKGKGLLVIYAIIRSHLVSIRKEICAKLRLNWPRTLYLWLVVYWAFLLYVPFE